MTAIAFTYDLSTSVGQARLYAGDTDPGGLNRPGGDRTRTDDEIAFLLTTNGGDARIAAAAVLESKAAEYAALASSIRQGSLTQDYRERSLQMRQAALQLRAVAGLPAFSGATSPDPLTPDGAAS